MNRTLLRVSGIISIIIGILCCLTIIGAIVGVPLIIGGSKFNDYSKMNDEEIEANKDSILIWTIVFLFINQISGVISLVAYILYEASNSNYVKNKRQNSKYDELERIKKLYDEKILSKEEYEMEKSRILNH
jgi:phosphate/sulfate permease